MPRIIAAIVLVAVLALGGGLIANTAYQAGLSTAVTTAAGSGAVVAPVVVPPYAYGYGYGHPFGFGIFGFLGGLFFLFIIFGLLRAIFWRGGYGRRGGWGPGGWGGPVVPAGRPDPTTVRAAKAVPLGSQGQRDVRGLASARPCCRWQRLAERDPRPTRSDRGGSDGRGHGPRGTGGA